jgi:hypothetical protein
MNENMDQQNDIDNDDNMIDLTSPHNTKLLSGLDDLGDVGKLIKKLLDKAAREGKKLRVNTVNNALQIVIEYDGSRVELNLRVGYEYGDMGDPEGYYEITVGDYMKPWFKEMVDAEADADWLKITPLNIVDLTKMFTGQELGGRQIDALYPQFREKYGYDTYARIFTIACNEAGLEKYFNLKNNIAEGDSIDGWMFKIEFKSKDLEEKFYAKDNEMISDLRGIMDNVLASVKKQLAEMAMEIGPAD